ncbi:MAG TPA: hypothetical protein DDW52_13930 [Planctomycetaceae bacterium]|nr:hypothetical protein [Planctomycetaceae bacterium]
MACLEIPERNVALALTFLMIAVPVHCSAQSSADLRDEVSYTNDIRPIVNNFCTACHAGDDPEGEFVLTSYKDVVKHMKQGNLAERINDADDPMPPAGLMPAYMRRMFRVWADQGYINQGSKKANAGRKQMQEFKPPRISPVDINKQGFELLEYLQGHWVGSMNLMGQDFEWWAFDYRPISTSHIHAIFEGGTIGNLFTSFFVTEFNGKRTIMARNGGLLNGIYRTSYFVLENVSYGRDWAYYRLVDAYGGSDIMYMELTFRADTLQFKAFTSRFGLTAPRPHMDFQAKRMHPELATQAAKAVGFPKNVIDFDFSKGLPKPTWANDYPMTSATYIWEGANGQDEASRQPMPSIVEMGRLAKDPRRIDQMPYVSQLDVSVKRTSLTKGKKLLVYLSRDALVDARGRFIKQYGYIREDLLNTLLSFPELAKNQSRFKFTYLHPGSYYLTVIADMDDDGFPSPGDVTHSRRKLTVSPSSTSSVTINDLTVRN